MECVGGLDYDVGRAGDEVVSLQQPVDRGFRNEVSPFVGEPDGHFPRREFAILQRQFDDLVMDVRGDTVPDPAWRRWAVLQRLGTAADIAVIPAAEGPAGNAQLLQRPLGRQM